MSLGARRRVGSGSKVCASSPSQVPVDKISRKAPLWRADLSIREEKFCLEFQEIQAKSLSSWPWKHGKEERFCSCYAVFGQFDLCYRL